MEQALSFGQDFLTALQSGQTPAGLAGIYLAILLLTMVEGPVSILVAAGASSAGFLHPLPVFTAVTLGNLISDGLWYLLGYHGKIDWLLRRRRWFGVEAEKLELFKHIVQRQAVRLLLYAKITNGLIIPVLIATGMARVSMRRWLPVILVTNLLTSLVLVAAGYYAASSLLRIQEGLRYAIIPLTLLFLLAATIYMRRMLSRKDVSAVFDQPEG
jgi:membrane protein DedA with SNARE-associated domain